MLAYQTDSLLPIDPFFFSLKTSHNTQRASSPAQRHTLTPDTPCCRTPGRIVNRTKRQLIDKRWARGVDYPTARLPLASALFFGTVPYVGSVFVRMGFRMHPQDFVWWFLTYQVSCVFFRVSLPDARQQTAGIVVNINICLQTSVFFVVGRNYKVIHVLLYRRILCLSCIHKPRCCWSRKGR